jgi:hypothetical protein
MGIVLLKIMCPKFRNIFANYHINIPHR